MYHVIIFGSSSKLQIFFEEFFTVCQYDIKTIKFAWNLLEKDIWFYIVRN